MITEMDLLPVCQRFNWRVKGSLPAVISISTDSRHIEVGCLYIALVGERFDGHDFCQQAVDQGAAVVMVSKPVELSVPTIVVPDTLRAYGLLGLIQREQFTGTVVALTGSAGKTTTKMMLATILASVEKTCATQANYNNEIGVPKTLLSINAEHRFAVLELGAAKIGDIAYLCDFVKPNIALITNAAGAHIEGFGSLDGIAQGKGEIYQSLESGTAVINSDSPYYAYWCDLAKGNHIVTFGLSNSADIYAADIETAIDSCCFDVIAGAQRYQCQLPLPGEHNVMNALAAICCAYAAGVPVSVSVDALASIHSVNSRMQLLQGINGSQLIDDSYNANPTAFERAIDTLAVGQGKRWLLMGDMGELGANEVSLHRQVGAYALQQGIDELYSVGALSKHASEAFGGRHFSTYQAMVEAVAERLSENDIVLIKGSRSARMERVVQALTTTRRETTC